MSLSRFKRDILGKTTDQLDQKLVVRVQKGDRAAFDLLLVKYQNKVASIVARFVSSQDDIADITQEVFIKAYRSIHTFRGDSSFYTWLYRIAINHAKSFVQKNKTRMLHKDHFTSQSVEANTLSSLETPESLLTRSELVDQIEYALSNMPPDLSIALMLREFDGLSYDEISQVMECPVGTVRSRIFRARELLDKTIKKTSGSST